MMRKSKGKNKQYRQSAIVPGGVLTKQMTNAKKSLFFKTSRNSSKTGQSVASKSGLSALGGEDIDP